MSQLKKRTNITQKVEKLHVCANNLIKRTLGHSRVARRASRLEGGSVVVNKVEKCPPPFLFWRGAIIIVIMEVRAPVNCVPFYLKFLITRKFY